MKPRSQMHRLKVAMRGRWVVNVKYGCRSGQVTDEEGACDSCLPNAEMNFTWKSWTGEYSLSFGSFKPSRTSA